MIDAILKDLQACGATGQDLSQARDGLRVYAEEAKQTRPDRNRLREVARSLFELEKTYVPRLNQELAEVLDCSVLVATVGLIKDPIILTILSLSPARLHLLHTSGSKRVADEIEEDPDVEALGLKRDDTLHLHLFSETDALANYRVVVDDILAHINLQTARVVVDPTGGRKIMGVSLSTVAFWRRLPMVYLDNQELRPGIIWPFSERVCRIDNPYDYFGDPDLRLIGDFYARHDYDAAFQACDQLLRVVGDPMVYARLRVAKDLIEIYRDWDAFAHSGWYDASRRRLAQRLEDIQQTLIRLNFTLVEPKQLDKNIHFLRQIDQGWKPETRNLCDKYRLVDLFANAQRRARARRYDDAVARLYRCLEMCSTIQLRSAGLVNPARPDYSGLAEELGGLDKLRIGFEALTGQSLPSRFLMLRSQMALLELLKRPIGRMYRDIVAEEEGSDSLMSLRNRSILAHGTTTVGEKEYQAFEDKVWEFLVQTIGKNHFAKLLDQAQHPTLEW
jgi:CRISPR-associated protein (TIGR02710 family)